MTIEVGQVIRATQHCRKENAYGYHTGRYEEAPFINTIAEFTVLGVTDKSISVSEKEYPTLISNLQKARCGAWFSPMGPSVGYRFLDPNKNTKVFKIQ